MKKEKVLDVNIVSQRLGVSTDTIYRMARRGEIIMYKRGKKSYRIPESEVSRVESIQFATDV